MSAGGLGEAQYLRAPEPAFVFAFRLSELLRIPFLSGAPNPPRRFSPVPSSYCRQGEPPKNQRIYFFAVVLSHGSKVKRHPRPPVLLLPSHLAPSLEATDVNTVLKKHPSEDCFIHREDLSFKSESHCAPPLLRPSPLPTLGCTRGAPEPRPPLSAEPLLPASGPPPA